MAKRAASGKKKSTGKTKSAKKTTAKAAPAAGRKSGAAKKKASVKAAGAGKRKSAAKRELIDTGTDKRFVRRAAKGTFKESDDVGTSLSVDRRTRAKTKVKSGQGDKGDR